MNFFYKNRLIFWVLFILVVINISALISFFLLTKPREAPPCCTPEEQQCNAFQDELKLSSSQIVKVQAINKNYTDSAGPIALSIKEARAAILNELEKEIPDTVQLNKMTNQLALLQMKIQTENIKQYIALKRVCTTAQASRLSALYRDLYGCPMRDGTMNHRHRQGQEN
jgi:hypothetical protein